MIAENTAEILSNMMVPTTSAELFKKIKNNTSSHIPDPETLSKLIYSTRSKGLLQTYEAGSKKLHQVTYQGLDELEKFNKSIKPIEQVEPVEQVEPIEQVAPIEPVAQAIDPKALLLKVIAHIDSLPGLPVIKDKQIKIDTLARLGEIVSSDISAVLANIIEDLKGANG